MPLAQRMAAATAAAAAAKSVAEPASKEALQLLGSFDVDPSDEPATQFAILHLRACLLP